MVIMPARHQLIHANVKLFNPHNEDAINFNVIESHGIARASSNLDSSLIQRFMRSNPTSLNLDLIITYKGPQSEKEKRYSLGANLFAKLIDDPHPMTDYNIRSTIDECDVPCHKFILAARSPIFR